tara:strand:+ start:1940 stop:2950 length:1011 start_codon:yes stop_codon:yes gene_type:complete
MEELTIDDFVEEVMQGRKDLREIAIKLEEGRNHVDVPKLNPQYTTDLDLSDSHLAGINFKGLDLSGSKFDRSLLIGGSFEDARLEDASFEGAVFSYGTHDKVNGVTYDPTNFSRARMRRANLRATFANDVDFSEADLSYAVVGVGSDFSGEVMDLPDDSRSLYTIGEHKEGGGFHGGAKLRFSDFRGASLRYVDFRGLDMWKVDLRDADLTGANFYKTTLDGSKLNRGTKIKDTEFRNALFDLSEFDNVNFSHGNFRDAYFCEAIFTGHTDFSNADLQNADFSNFDGNYSRGAKFDSVDFRGANLTGTKLKGAHTKDLYFDKPIPELGHIKLLTHE